MKRQKPLPENVNFLWPDGHPIEEFRRINNRAPWLAQKLIGVLYEHDTETKVNVALVDVAIHYGMALEATRRQFAQPTAALPLEVVEAMAVDYAERFRTNFDTQTALQALPWSAIRANAIQTAINMGRVSAQALQQAGQLPSAQASAVTTAADVEAKVCQSNYPNGAGITCDKPSI